MTTPASNRRMHPVTVQQAAQDSPMLAKLSQLAQESSERLKAIELLIPAALRTSVKAGPLDGTTWCLLVEGNAAAAKLRQVAPAIVSRLQERGWQVNSIRLKVQLQQK